MSERKMHHKITWEKAVTRRSKLPLPAIAVLRAAADYANGDGTSVRPGLRLLAEGLGISKNTASKWMRVGEDAGWLHKLNEGYAVNGVEVASEYRLTIPEWVDVAGLNDKARAGEGPPSGQPSNDRVTARPRQRSNDRVTAGDSVPTIAGQPSNDRVPAFQRSRDSVPTILGTRNPVGTHKEHNQEHMGAAAAAPSVWDEIEPATPEPTALRSVFTRPSDVEATEPEPVADVWDLALSESR